MWEKEEEFKRQIKMNRLEKVKQKGALKVVWAQEVGSHTHTCTDAQPLQTPPPHTLTRESVY